MLGMIIAAVILIITAAVAFFLLRTTPETEKPGQEVTFPVVEPGGTGTQQVPTAQIPAADGTSVEVRDFTKLPTTVADTMNPGVYYLAGSPEYCFDGGECPKAAELPGVNILYNANYGTFTVALLDEPLSAMRVSAQNFLMATLGISQDEMCALSAYVGTDSGVNETYAGQSLGFSFCPGAIALP